MKRSELNSNIQARQHFQNIWEKLRVARKQLLRVDIKPGDANTILYNSALQWVNSALEELTIEEDIDETKDTNG